MTKHIHIHVHTKDSLEAGSSKATIGKNIATEIRAGYKIGVDPDGTDQHGYTNVKPGTSDAKIKHRAMGGQSK